MKPLIVHLFSMEQILSDMIHGPVRHGEDRSNAAISDHAGESINNSNGSDYIALNFPVPKISLTNKARLHILPSQKIMCTVLCMSK
jgi:hypothetical protein